MILVNFELTKFQIINLIVEKERKDRAESNKQVDKLCLSLENIPREKRYFPPRSGSRSNRFFHKSSIHAIYAKVWPGK